MRCLLLKGTIHINDFENYFLPKMIKTKKISKILTMLYRLFNRMY